jgi:hypothetical protein
VIDADLNATRTLGNGEQAKLHFTRTEERDRFDLLIPGYAGPQPMLIVDGYLGYFRTRLRDRD